VAVVAPGILGCMQIGPLLQSYAALAAHAKRCAASTSYRVHVSTAYRIRKPWHVAYPIRLLWSSRIRFFVLQTFES